MDKERQRMKLYLSVAWRLFAGQTDRRGWGCLFAAATTGLAATTGACLVLFTPEVFSWPYSLEEVGMAALVVAVVIGGLWLLLGLMFGFGVGDTIKNIQDHVKWYRADPPSPTSRVGRKRR